MKLNLGCGFNKLNGYVNVDVSELCRPDLCFDLESTWPIEDSVVDEIVLHHTMEHLGETVNKFMTVMKELYRVSADECIWKITVPHYNSDIFHIDPTHVRKISPITLKMFDQKFNVQDLVNKGHHTKLGLMTGVDIELIKEIYTPNDSWGSKYFNKEITEADMNFAGTHYNNVCKDIYIECRVHKPERYSFENIKHLYD
jgi:hypothetical protein